jgi:hypothetical protein
MRRYRETDEGEMKKKMSTSNSQPQSAEAATTSQTYKVIILAV